VRLHLVDGTFELYRAHFSKRPGHTAPEGWDAKATVGVVTNMLSLLHEEAEHVTHVAIAFDNPIRSFRNDLFDAYKGDEGVPPELRAQFDKVEEAVRSIGMVVWSMNEWEADDALATAAARFRDRFDQVRILTPDKDLGQCIRGTKVVQVDRMRQNVIDEADLLVKRGITPASIPDYLALVGDTADGIPGLDGFGEKTSATLLREYVHLEAIPKSAAEWKVNVRGAPVLAATLAAHMDEAVLYRKLATLVSDVPLAETLEDLRWKGVRKAVYATWCDEMNASDALRRRISVSS
jgi:5'-3' exonuclease